MSSNAKRFLPALALQAALLAAGLAIFARSWREPTRALDILLAVTMVAFLGVHVHTLAGGHRARRVARATVVRMWQVLWSYKFQLLAILVQLVVFAFLLVTLGRPVVRALFGPIGLAMEGHMTTNFVVFVLLGLSFFPVLWASYEVTHRRLREEQYMGMLEVLVATPAGIETLPFAYLVSSVASSLVSLAGVLTVFTFILPEGSLRISDPGAIAVFVTVMAPAVVTMWGIGLVLGGVTTLFKAAGPASNVLRILFVAFAGVYIPLVFLPPWGQALANLLPVTHAGTGVRGALAEGVYAVDVWKSLAVLLMFALVMSVLGMWLFRRLLARSRATGTLTGY